MSHLKKINATLTGTQIASEMTATLQKKFGDQAFYDLTDASSTSFQISSSRITSGTGSSTSPVAITLFENIPASGSGANAIAAKYSPITNIKQATIPMDPNLYLANYFKDLRNEVDKNCKDKSKFSKEEKNEVNES
jgi:hypothetical protein